MPKDKHPPAFPFYVDDFISDSAVDAMTNRELGIYVRLMCKAWKEDDVGTIPADDDILSRWAKENLKDWAKMRPAVLRAFANTGDGRYHQKRMKLEWEKMQERSRAKSKAGQKGMANRWHGDNRDITEGITNDNLSSSVSVSSSISIDDDDDGARCFSLEDLSEIRAKANRIFKIVGSSSADDRNLLAKVAVLWHLGRLSDDDVEQTLESFDRKSGIKNKRAWLHTCLSNRCDNFEAMLVTTAVPPELNAERGGA